MRQFYIRLAILPILWSFCPFVWGQNGTLVAPANPAELNEMVEVEDIRMQMHDINGLPYFINDLFYRPTHDLRVFRIQYETEDENNVPVIASGLVLIPNALSCQSSIAVYCHQMVMDDQQPPLHEVPSHFNFSDPSVATFQNHEKVVAMGLASNGYIVVLPDYIGLGSADLNNQISHLFLDKRTQASATLDAIRATRELCDLLGYYVPNDYLFMTGFSQGAHAAMSTLEYVSQENLSNEFRFLHAGLSSGPYDLGGVQLDYLEQASNGLQSVQVMRDYFETSCTSTFPNALDDCYHYNTNSDWANIFPSIPISMTYCTADLMFPGSNAIVAKEHLRDGMPEYLFWERQRIQALIAGAYQHQACSVPSMFAAKMGHDARRVFCPGRSANEKSLGLSILLGEEAGIRHNHFGANYIVLDLSEVDFEINRAEFINIKGKLIKTEYDPLQIRNRVALDIRDLKEGVYAVRLHTTIEDQFWIGVMKTSPEVIDHEAFAPVVIETETTHTIDVSGLEEDIYSVVFMDHDKEVMDVFGDKWLIGSEAQINKEWMKAGVRLVELQTPSWSYTFHFPPDQEGDDDEMLGERTIRVEPNPVQAAKIIRIEGVEGNAEQVGLYDMNGQQLLQVFPKYQSASTVQLEIPNLFAGIYLVKVHMADGQAMVSRIVVTR